MRRRCLSTVFVMIAVMCLPSAAPAGGRRHLDDETRQLAGALLDGRTLIARIYPDAAKDPTHFEKVRVPLTGLGFAHSVVKTVYPALSEPAYIVFLGADQTDEIVAALLGRRVYLSPCRENGIASINPVPGYAAHHPRWTFFDASGNPMPGAAVELWMRGFGTQPDILLTTTTLDGKSRLERLFPLGEFVLRISHPDYGAAIIEVYGQKEDPSGIWVVPLVPLGSEAAGSSIQGIVEDSEGRPVPGAVISCPGVERPNAESMSRDERFMYRAVTDESGWFAFCYPNATEDLALGELPPTGSRYGIHIEPPKYLSLRQRGFPRPIWVYAGARTTFTLTSMEPGKVFHTFAFEYAEGPVTDPEELKRMKLTLIRDTQTWARLTFNQFKAGCALPTGTLRAETWRWGRPFMFGPLQLTPDSPEHLIARANPLLYYQGQVVDSANGQPIPGAIVSVGSLRGDAAPCSVTDEQWRALQTLLAETATDESPDGLYHLRNRVAATDAEGLFEIPFMPGLYSHINGFIADKPGYLRTGVGIAHMPDAAGLVEVRTVKLQPIESLDYVPFFLFEDERGAAIDPNDLKNASLNIRTPDGRSWGGPLIRTLARRPFRPGTYYLEAIWGRNEWHCRLQMYL